MEYGTILLIKLENSEWQSVNNVDDPFTQTSLGKCFAIQSVGIAGTTNSERVEVSSSNETLCARLHRNSVSRQRKDWLRSRRVGSRASLLDEFNQEECDFMKTTISNKQNLRAWAKEQTEKKKRREPGVILRYRSRPRHEDEILCHNNSLGYGSFRYFVCVRGGGWKCCPCGWRPELGPHYAIPGVVEYVKRKQKHGEWELPKGKSSTWMTMKRA
jgi:hypothetical protein